VVLDAAAAVAAGARLRRAYGVARLDSEEEVQAGG
jgi:hypothetical protein